MSSPFGPTGPVPGLPNEPLESGAEELVIGGKTRARRGTATAIALIAGGALAGGILASTVGASASNSTTAAETAASSPAPAASSPSPGQGKRPDFAGAPRLKQLTGTVTAVGSDTVTIKTSTATTTYSVTSTSHISINETGPGALSGVKVGDTVFFSTTTDGGTVIANLRDGAGPAGGFGGGPGGGRGPGGPGFGGMMGMAAETGTVTAVGTDTVSIKTSTATTTYSVPSASHILKPGTANAKLSDVKVGDSVFFTVTTKGGTVIGNLFDGKLPTVAGGHGFGGRPGGGPGGPMNPQGPAAPSPSASTAATNT